MSVPRSRLLDIIRAQCRIFSTTFNPEGLRLGNKVLRQRLKGPALAAYYPRRTVTWKDLKKAYPDFEFEDLPEMERLDHLQSKKERGKGNPKKKRTAAESKKFAGKRKKTQSIAAE